MSTCDTCRNPGRCCFGFYLHSASVQAAETPLEVLVELATVFHDDEWMGYQGLPFMPLYKTSVGHWLLWCPRLGRDGRCNDYENRPKLCRTYEPGSDRLCAEYTPPPPDENDIKKEQTA